MKNVIFKSGLTLITLGGSYFFIVEILEIFFKKYALIISLTNATSFNEDMFSINSTRIDLLITFFIISGVLLLLKGFFNIKNES